MKFFITSTHNYLNKEPTTKAAYDMLVNRGYKVAIYKTLQLEQYQLYRDEVVSELNAKYLVPSLSKFDLTSVANELYELETTNDVVLIEGFGSIGMPLSEVDGEYYMTIDMIRDFSDAVITVIPNDFETLSHMIVTTNYLRDYDMNNLCVIQSNLDIEVIKKELTVMEKILNQSIVTLHTMGDHQIIKKQEASKMVDYLKGQIKVWH